MAFQFPDVDEELVERIVDRLKSQGIFDQFRKDCLADVDSRPAYQNLRDKVNGAVADFLSKQPWKDDSNKNKVRESLRKHVQQSYLESGVNRIVEQVVNPKVFSVFMPKVEDVVYQVMGIEKPANLGDRSHNRLRLLLSNLPSSPADALSEMLPSDLDPVSPGSINESGNESANLNDSIASKINDDADNVSRDITKESNLDVNEASNESKLSGISDLSSHGSTTKLDISESAHLPGDKTEMNCDGSQGEKSNSVEGDKLKQGANESANSGGFDFDNFSNLKEKLMKTDPLNKNVMDKDRVEVTTTHISETVLSINESETINEPNSSESKHFKEDSLSVGVITLESKADKIQTKSPVSYMYSEDSMGSNCSQRSKLKSAKINPLNESTRNSILECEDSSASILDKKFNELKEHETVSCIESLREESQMSIISNESRKASNFPTLKSINDNSREVSEVSSPDFSKHVPEDKNKSDEKDKKKNSSHSSHRSDKSGSKYDYKNRSRDSSRDRRYGKSKTCHDKDGDRSRHGERDPSRESSRKDYSTSRDKYSSKSKDSKRKSDSKTDRDRSRHGDRRSNDESKKDSKERDSKRSSNYDDKAKREKEMKNNLEEDRKSSGSKDSRNSSDDDRNKDCKKDYENANENDEKSVSEESKKGDPFKSSSEKDKELKSSEDQKSIKLKEKDIKHLDDHRASSSKDKDTKSYSDEEKHAKKDQKKMDESKSSKLKEKDDKKISNSKEKDSKCSGDRKISTTKEKDSKYNYDDKYSKREKGSKSSEVIKERNSKQTLEDDIAGKNSKDNKTELSGDKFKAKDKPSGSDKESYEKEKRKHSNSSEINPKKDEKKPEKEPKKRKRENCNEEADKREHRRSRDRDDGGHKNSGRQTEDKKDGDRKGRSSSSKQDTKVSSSGKKKSKEASDENNDNSSTNDIDLILERIGSSIKEEDLTNDQDDTVNESELPQVVVADSPEISGYSENGFKTLKKPKIANNIFEMRKVMNARKQYQKKLDENNEDKNQNEPEMIANTLQKENNTIVNDQKINNVAKDNEIIEDTLRNNETAKHFLDNSETDNAFELNEKQSDDCESDTESTFNGFEQNIINLSFKTYLNFENYMRSTYNFELSSDISMTDKCFSVTDNNLNDIGFKKMPSLIKECRVDIVSICKSPTMVFDSSNKNGTVLSPVTRRIMNNCVNEGADTPEDSLVSQTDMECMTSKIDSHKTLVARITRRNADKLTKPSVSSKETEQAKPMNEDGTSLNDSSSSEHCFTLPTLTEDMLDNFMKENIDKAEDCYASSESEIEDSCTAVTTEIHQESPKKKKVAVKTKPRTTNEKKSPSSDKTVPSKEEKKTTPPRTSQRYSNTDLYKPRPLISNSSRRNRVPNKNESELTRGTKRSSDSMEFSENKKPR